MTDDSLPDISMTPRQTEVAQLAAQSFGYQEIADALGISKHTARAHIVAIANRIPGEKNPLRRVAVWMSRRSAEQ